MGTRFPWDRSRLHHHWCLFLGALIVAFDLQSQGTPSSHVLAWGDNTAQMLNTPSDTVGRVVALGVTARLGIIARDDGVLVAWPAHWHPDLNTNLAKLPRLPGVRAVTFGNGIVILQQDGTPLALDGAGVPLTEQPPYRDLDTVVGAHRHFVGLQRDGTAVAWGNDTLANSVRGVPTGIAAVATSETRTVLLTRDGTLLDWSWGEARPLPTAPPEKRFTAVAISDRVTYAVRSDGTVAAWDRSPEAPKPVLPPGLSNVVRLAVGTSHVMALRSDTTVVTWGDPFFLHTPPDLSGVHTVVAGHGLCLTLGVPRIPEILAQPASVAVRGWEQAVLTAQVRGYALQMQWRKDGQIVPGATNSTLVIPASAVARAAGQYVLEVRNPSGVVTSDAATLSVLPGEPPGGAMVWGRGAQYVSADDPHEFAGVAATDHGFLLLQSDGRVMHCGTWPGAQPEILEEWSSVTAVAASVNFRMFLRENGDVWRHGPFGRPQRIPELRGAVAIAAGWDYSLGIMADGSLVTDRATLPPRLGPVRFVSAWGDLATAVQTNGELVVWGQGDANFRPWVREAPKTTNALAAVLGERGGLVLLSDGTAQGWPDSTRVPRNLSDVVQIAAGSSHEMALRRDGTVVAFGDDSFRQISVPDGLSEVVGIAGGSESAIAIGRPPKPPEIEGGQVPSRISLGSTAKLSVAASGFGLSFQWRREGVDIPGATQAEHLVANVQADAAGAYSVLVCTPAGCQTVNVGRIEVAADIAPGTAISWGPGQRSAHYPYTGMETVPDGVVGATAIAAEGTAAIAVLNDGTVRAWGGAMGPDLRVPPDRLNGVVMADAGSGHFAAVRADGSVVCWGRDFAGQCQVPGNLGSVTEVAAGSSFTAALRRDGAVEIWGRWGQRLELPGSFQSIRAYGEQLAVLRTDGVVLAGRNWQVLPIMSNRMAIAVGGEHVLGLSADGEVRGWPGDGSDPFGGATVPQDLHDVIAIAAGEFYSMALRRDGTIRTWGHILDRSDYTLRSPTPTENLPGAFAIAACDATGYALIGDRPGIPLRIQRDSAGLEVLWPVSAGPKVLRSAESLNAPAWTPWPGERIAGNGWVGIRGATTTDSSYFRLGDPD